MNERPAPSLLSLSLSVFTYYCFPHLGASLGIRGWGKEKNRRTWICFPYSILSSSYLSLLTHEKTESNCVYCTSILPCKRLRD